MPFPAGFPPRSPSNRRSIRFFVSGTTTALFEDNAFLFKDDVGANTFAAMPIIRPGDTTTVVNIGSPSSPVSTDAELLIFSNSIRIYNDGATDLDFSFDGTNVQGVVKAGKDALYNFRYEGGIAVKSAAPVLFRIECW